MILSMARTEKMLLSMSTLEMEHLERAKAIEHRKMPMSEFCRMLINQQTIRLLQWDNQKVFIDDDTYKAHPLRRKTRGNVRPVYNDE